MSDDLVTLERNDDEVAVVTLNNGKVNALSSGVVSRLHEFPAPSIGPGSRACLAWRGANFRPAVIAAPVPAAYVAPTIS